ncbi:all-trans-retinol 13,14-reductase-like [Ambystoma mexicanum]|uniref:all-trans-retinol 13,14-reductase-like n=1 Tax=Ambystoma mexicanum TaxID=8296 RepID=UPI0037E82B6C
MWLLCFAAVLLPLFVLSKLWGRKKASQNPFHTDVRRPPAPLVIDKAVRRQVIKQGFEVEKVPKYLDAVVIGSGIGGMAVAAILAKAGKRVLVVEQLAKTGGCCHTFNEQGYEFDVGIHYIGQLGEGDNLRLIIDQLTEDQLQWAPMDDPFDVVIMGPNSKRYPLHSGRKAYADGLKKLFPGEVEAIDKYMELIQKVSKCAFHLVILKLIPLSLANFLCRTGVVSWLSPYFQMSSKSVSQVLSELTTNEELRAVLAYNYLDYGVLPRNASFSQHALLVEHFLEGAWYPCGGASEIAFHLIPVIEKAGGAVLARAPVKRILVDGTGRACGVNVQRKGRDPVNIYAQSVISDAGIFNTYEKLLPAELQALPGIRSQLSCVRHGLAGFSVFVGLDGTKEELGLPATNFFIFPNKNLNDTEDPYFSSPREEAPQHIPVLFVSFPSAKDPTHEQRCPGKSSLTILTLVRYEWFDEWKDFKVQKRGAEYEELKKTFADAMMETVMQHFPKICEKVVCVSSGTPLSNQHYLGASLGEFYGADHSIERLSAEATAKLRAQTPIENLYLTGQDVFLCGFAGALHGAMVCASGVLGRQLYFDVQRLAKRIKSKCPKKVD